MDAVIAELSAGFSDTTDLLRAIVRLLVAMLCGAVVGLQREQMGKPAGLRTHMLVATATALFIIAGADAGMAHEQLSRVIQGIVTGIGFLGAGAILKLDREREITGLTTAAGIWMTAAVGVAAGLGRLGTALASAALAWTILALVGRLESGHQARGARHDDGE